MVDRAISASRGGGRLLLLLAAWLPSGCDCLAVGSALTGRACARAPARGARAASVDMIEAFDLFPVMECLKLASMDQVQTCMDYTLEPWMSINDDGDVSFSLNALNGFIGGSVGVIGTVVSTLIKKEQVKDRIKCTYCNGSGQIVCGHCLGTGIVSSFAEDGTLMSGPCQNCEGSGTVVCINCQGSGMSVPDDFLQVLGDEEVGFTEEDYIGLFDETPIPGKPMTTMVKSQPPVASAAPANAPASVGAASASSPDKPQPTDYTGGLG